MDDDVQESLVLAVLSELSNIGTGAPSKTKLLKLLYLIDLEVVRSTGSTLTGWTWKFLHFGPWAAEYDELLTVLAQRDDVVLKAYGAEERTTLVIPKRRASDLSKLGDGTVQNAVARVLNRWGRSDLPEILNYVYFDTEPMQDVERNAPLEFSRVPRGQYPVYRRASSGADPKTVRAMRARMTQSRPVDRKRQPHTPPRYDDAFIQALSALEDD